MFPSAEAGKPEIAHSDRQEPPGNGDQQESDPGCGRHVKSPMRRGTPPAQVIIVHAGEIVVHQGVGVNRFNGCRHPGNTG